MMNQRTAAALLAIGFLVSLASSMRAQRFGQANPAMTEASVDDAALGLTSRGFLQYSRGSDIYGTVTGGIAMGPGVLRASYSNADRYHSYGIGYAARVAERQLGIFGTLGVGADLSAGYHDQKYLGYAPRGVRLAIPVSLRWGTPSRLSITPYVAPYAEVGRANLTHAHCEAFSCVGPLTYSTDVTRAAGLGAGFAVTAWRLGLDVNVRDLLIHDEHFDTFPTITSFQVNVGVRWRF
jgi:hypothetical protein